MTPHRYTCWDCKATFATVTESLLHATGQCPSPTIRRPVHCWACAHPIDLRDGPTCPECGRDWIASQP